jgi:hypothetical protein
MQFEILHSKILPYYMYVIGTVEHFANTPGMRRPPLKFEAMLHYLTVGSFCGLMGAEVWKDKS